MNDDFSYCWCVSYDDFDDFIKYIMARFKDFANADLSCFKEYYHGSEYLYLYVSRHVYLDDAYELTYTNNYIDNLLEENDNYRNMGEFLNRRKKLEKLNNISNS